MEKRDLKIMFAKSGNGFLTTRLSVPKAWVDDMEITQDEREVEVEYNTETKEITIKKK